MTPRYLYFLLISFESNGYNGGSRWAVSGASGKRLNTGMMPFNLMVKKQFILY